jgi:hypothetical protein
MKFIHTFWSKPLLNNKFGQFKDSLTNTLFDYACSASFIHKFGEKIVLYADKNGARILSCIPYDEVHIIDGLDDESMHFAAQIKFEALKRCDLGDIIIDGDLFLRTKEAIEYIKNTTEDVVYSFYEPFTYVLRNDYTLKFMDDLVYCMRDVKYKKPYKLPTSIREFAYTNTSLMKFNNKDILNKYIKQYYYHKDKLKDCEFNGWPDLIIEQRFLTILIESTGCTHKPIIDNYHVDPEANNRALDLGFTHLGSAKSQYLNWVETMLKENDESLYRDTCELLCCL